MGVLKARVGSTWEPVMGAQWQSPGNALGVVAIGSFKAGAHNSAQASGTVITNTLTYTPLVGRRYRLNFSVRAANVSSGGYSQMKVDGAIGVDAHFIFGGTGNVHPILSYNFDGDGVAHTYDVQLGVSSGTFTPYLEQATSHFYIEDVGPNSSPPLTLPVTAPAWTPLALNTGWAASGGGFPTPSYRKIGDVVEARGLVSCTTANAQPIATLPVGFRPPAIPIFATTTQDSFGEVRVTTAGQITVNYPSTWGVGLWIALDPIRFSTTA